MRSVRPAFRAAAAAATLAVVAALGGGPAAAVTVSLDATPQGPDEFPAGYAVVDELEPRTVLRVRAAGFEPYAVAIAKQCLYGVDLACAGRFPVQFGSDGNAYFQYEVRDDFHAAVVDAGRCRAGAGRCTLVVEAIDGAERAEIDTVFDDRAPEPGIVRVAPSSGLTAGQVVEVTVEGFPPDRDVVALLCVAPDVAGPRRCGAPGPSAPLRVGEDGKGSTRLEITAGPVGIDGLDCRGRRSCGVSVVSPDTFARANVVPISFAAPEGAGYDPTRLGVGVGVAAVLAGVALWLLRRTDWSPVGEAAAPEIDGAEYADLDAIVDALPPEEPDNAEPDNAEPAPR